MSHTLDPKRLQEVFDALEEKEDKLSEWERDTFVPSVKKQWQRNGKLSERQMEILEEAYLKV